MSSITNIYHKKRSSLTTQETKMRRESGHLWSGHLQVLKDFDVWRWWVLCASCNNHMWKNMRTDKFRVLEYVLGLKWFCFSKSHNVWEEKHVKLCILLLPMYIDSNKLVQGSNINPFFALKVGIIATWELSMMYTSVVVHT